MSGPSDLNPHPLSQKASKFLVSSALFLTLSSSATAEEPNGQAYGLTSSEFTKTTNYYSNYTLPIEWHWINYIGPLEETIQLEDGSYWTVSEDYASVMKLWQINEPIELTPNFFPFSSYPYYLTNKGRGESVRVKLKTGPYVGGYHTYTVYGLDFLTGHLILQRVDEYGELYLTTWCISSDNFYSFQNYWQLGDAIILGNYPSWFSDYNILMINLRLADQFKYFRVKPY